jgi:cellobiose phosphorylase
MYKTGIEYILGLKVEGDTLTIDPCIPKEWPGFEMEYKWKKTIYSIEVVNPNHSSKGVKEVTVDGVKKEKNSIKLTDDKKSHTIKIKMV